tara:strand:+ start:223 stop:1173 length:951 start_codon:yes stop_codon:yes gene_type:complete
MIKKTRSFICGIKGIKLNTSEIKFLKKYRPWGVILFSRNIRSIKQTVNLTNSIKEIFKDNHYPILIDEEGGKVSRLNNFINSSLFSARFFGNLYKKNKKQFFLYHEVYIKQISYLLNLLGINLNSVPVLDLYRDNSHKVIGSRSYSKNPKIASNIGNYCISVFKKNKIGTIIKHIPGHGLAKVDSHKKLPYVKNSLSYLNKHDFFPFKKKDALFAMTAHIIYQKIDPHNCATLSKKIINLIRHKIGFKNLIISDDLSMKALKGPISQNTKKAFTAGCNLVLHCNGNYKEMCNVAENSPFVNSFIIKKTSQFKEIIS